MTDDLADMVTSGTWSTTSTTAVDFYTKHLGFTLRMSAAPAFADVVRGRLRLLLSGPASSAGRPMPDGATPAAGGWNRIHLIVGDIAAEVDRLRAAGLTFRNDIVSGPGGQQILLEGPVRQRRGTVPAPPADGAPRSRATSSGTGGGRSSLRA